MIALEAESIVISSSAILNARGGGGGQGSSRIGDLPGDMYFQGLDGNDAAVDIRPLGGGMGDEPDPCDDERDARDGGEGGDGSEGAARDANGRNGQPSADSGGGGGGGAGYILMKSTDVSIQSGVTIAPECPS